MTEQGMRNPEPSRVVALVPSEGDHRRLMDIAKAMFESGYWQDVKSIAQAYVRIQAGQEWGIPPFMAMSAVHIIQGKPTMAAGAIASKIKGSGKYDYRIVTLSARECVLEFYQQGQSLGRETFTAEDARTAELTGKDNWRHYPKNMLFARCLTNGARFHCPDVFGGSIYTPEELGAGAATAEDVPIVVAASPADSERIKSDEEPALTKCTDCGEPIMGRQGRTKLWTAEELIELSKETYERPLCYDCSAKAKAAKAETKPQ